MDQTLGLVVLVSPAVASAYTEFLLTSERLYVGGRFLWINFMEGGVGTIDQADPDSKPVLSS